MPTNCSIMSSIAAREFGMSEDKKYPHHEHVVLIA